MSDRVATVGQLALTVAVVLGNFLPETPPACRTAHGALWFAFGAGIWLASVIAVVSLGMRLIHWCFERRARRRR